MLCYNHLDLKQNLSGKYLKGGQTHTHIVRFGVNFIFCCIGVPQCIVKKSKTDLLGYLFIIWVLGDSIQVHLNFSVAMYI